MTDAEYNSIFKLPFAEASEFFRQKLNIPTNRWDDLWKDEHAKGFMTAGAKKADLLNDMRNAVQQSIDGKLTLPEFQAKFDHIVAKHGWSYNGSRNWRSELIYDTNITTAYQAGRWEQFVKGGTEYLRYVHADGVMHPRPLHLAWHGITLPINHPWWNTNFPPNGWHCHCRAVRATGPEWAKAKARGQGEAPPMPVDPKTDTPIGIDKGWDYNVGKAGMHWQPNLDKYPFPIAKGIVTDMVRNQVFNRWHNAVTEKAVAEMAKPLYQGKKTAEIIDALRTNLSLGEKFPVAVLPPSTKVLIGAGVQGIYLSDYDLLKQAVSRTGQGFNAFDYYNVQDTVENAQIIVKNTGTVTMFVRDGTHGWYAAVLQRTKSGEGVFLKSFRRSNEKDALTQMKKGEVLKG